MENEKDNNVKKKIFTKERVLLFIIGMLTGAVITTAAFFIYVNVAGVNLGGSSSEQSMQMPGGTPPEMPDGEAPNGEGGTPPEKPGEKTTTKSDEQSE